MREDAAGNMYAHGVVEVEVSSAAEAFQVFCRGLKRKTMAHTVLNAESSRSHAVFTLRLVQVGLADYYPLMNDVLVSRPHDTSCYVQFD